MRYTLSGPNIRSAAELSAIYAAIYRHCHSSYTIALGHQSVRALQLISEDGSNVKSIAQHLGCAPNTASELVRRLVDMSLVSKHRGSGGDERAVEVRLTSEGERALLEHTGLDVEKLAAHLSLLSDQDRIDIRTGLERLLRCVTGR